MAGWGIDITDDVTPFLDRMDNLDLEDCVTAGANILKRNAERATPRDTGGLANSIRVDGSGMRRVVGYVAEHAPHVEYGHRQTPGRYVPAIGKRLKASFVPGQHFFKAAVERSRGEVRETIRRSFEREVG